LSIAENIRLLIHSVSGKDVTIVAVSKTKPVDMILEAYRAGQLVFGENIVQELIPKYESLPRDIEWHMIGHLQSKKVKLIAPFIRMIHSVDSLKLLNIINGMAKNNSRTIDCLLQVHIAEEETKYGFDAVELKDAVSEYVFGKFPNVRLRGLMGIATYTEVESVVRKEFRFLKALFDQIRKEQPMDQFNILSMGMSGDYEIAVSEGSNMIRVGSAIFGNR
jgi:PLP dependent protein